MIPARRVAITGLGAISAVGRNVRELLAALRDGRRGLRPVTLFDTTGYRTHTACEVTDLSPAGADKVSRTDRLGLCAAAEAIEDAGLAAGALQRTAIWVGGTTGGMFEMELALSSLHRDPSFAVDLAWLRGYPLSSTADRIAARFRISGARATICTACSSGANAIALGARAVASGAVETAICGGTDALSRLTYAGFNSLNAVDPEPCRPFDRARKGLNLGEAAGFLVLEALDAAIERGAPIHGELCGYGVGAEAHHITNPLDSGAGAAHVLRRALLSARIEPKDVGYVNAHGTATPLNDAMEALAIRDVFGPAAKDIPVSSSKSQLGHTLGAAGAVEAVIATLALEHGILPATLGLDDPDPACDLLHVREPGGRLSARFALSSSFGFGGNNTVLAFGSPAVARGPREVAPLGRRRVAVTGVGVVAGNVAGSSQVAALADKPAVSPPAETPFHAALDPARARRMDDLSHIVTAAAGFALSDAGVSSDAATECGAMLGVAFGSVDLSAAFVDRVFQKGPRFASPVDFPNSVMNAPSSHAAIYHGLKGPNLTVSALGASAEIAVAAAVDEIALGVSERLLAGGAEERTRLVVTALGNLYAHPGKDAVRSEGAGWVVLEAADAAKARGARIQAILGAHAEAWAPPDTPEAADLGALAARALGSALEQSGLAATDLAAVVVPTSAIAAGLPSAVRIVETTATAGYHEGLGGVSLAVAAALVLRDGRPVAVIGASIGAAVAFVLLPAA